MVNIKMYSSFTNGKCQFYQNHVNAYCSQVARRVTILRIKTLHT